MNDIGLKWMLLCVFLCEDLAGMSQETKGSLLLLGIFHVCVRICLLSVSLLILFLHPASSFIKMALSPVPDLALSRCVFVYLNISCLPNTAGTSAVQVEVKQTRLIFCRRMCSKSSKDVGGIHLFTVYSLQTKPTQPNRHGYLAPVAKSC